jgi:hypothetical protein
VYEVSGQKLLVANQRDVTWSNRRAADEAPEPESPGADQPTDRALIELIRYRLSLPPEKRLNCLRRKIGLRATCL